MYLLAIYCEIECLGIFILINIESEQTSGNTDAMLKSLQFFREKTTLLGHIKDNSLKIVNQKHRSVKNTPKSIFTLKRHIKQYGNGKEVNLALVAQRLNLLSISALFSTAFSKRVVKFLIKNVKYGETVSYSDIGKNINSKAYRAIGSVLKKNPLPLIIPCHRVIRKDGSIGGFMGKTNQNNEWAINLKRQLLNLEKSN